MTRERIRSALFAVDDAHGRVHDETDVAQRVDRVEQRAAGRDDVLDEADALALLVRALETVRRAVLLRLLANDQERQAGVERGGGRERDGAELRRGEPRRVGRVLPHGRGDALAERPQQLGPRLEAVLVEVVARALAGAKQEVAFEIRVLDERRGERIGALTGGGGEHVVRDGQQRVGLAASPRRTRPSSRRRSRRRRGRGRRRERAPEEHAAGEDAGAEADERRAAYASSSAFFSPRPLRLRRLGVGAAQAALQVVEDEPDRRRRAGRRRDPPVAVADDEDAALGGRGLELRHRRLVGAEAGGALEQVAAAPARAPGRRRRRRASSRGRSRSRRRARRPRSATRSRSDRRVPGRHPSSGVDG